MEVCAVQYPGRADRLDEPLIDDTGRARTGRRGRDGAVAGPARWRCSGTAWARWSRTRRRACWPHGRCRPAHLFVSAARAPHDHGKADEETFHDKDDDVLVAEMVRIGGDDATLLNNLELRSLVLPYVRNDFRLVETYHHRSGQLLDLPITALAGVADPLVTPTEMRKWAELTSGDFGLHEFPGDHFYSSSQEKAVLSIIAGCIGSAVPRKVGG